MEGGCGGGGDADNGDDDDGGGGDDAGDDDGVFSGHDMRTANLRNSSVWNISTSS